MSKIYKAAVLGVGKAGDGSSASKTAAGFQIGYTHGAMYTTEARETGRIELAAGVDIDADNLAAWSERFQPGSTYLDLDTMLREVRPDILSICTYVGTHLTFLEKAARAGVRAILCEKPFVLSPWDLEAVRRLVQETGVQISITHVRRHCAAYRLAAQLYQQGTVGQPLLATAYVPQWDLSEMASHHLDALRQFYGDAPVEWVMGQFRVRDMRAFGHAMEEHAMAYFGFRGGGRALVEAGAEPRRDGTDGLADCEYQLCGTNGVILVHGLGHVTLVNQDGRQEYDLRNEPAAQWMHLWSLFLKDAIAWLDGGPEAQLGFFNASQTAQLNLGAYLSAVRRDRVDFPLQDVTAVWPVELLVPRAKSA